ncbi:MAG: chemotaxis protein CheA [Spirochaetales bacterium]|nr:chemotaxis protein CheA [Spirochaetales bacterium]
MDLKKAEGILENISFLALDYTEGDLLAVNRLMDEITLFQKTLEKDEIINALAAVILGILGKLAKGSVISNSREAIVEGIDLFTKVIAERMRGGKSVLPPALSGHVDTYRQKFKDTDGQQEKKTAAKTAGKKPLPGEKQKAIIKSEAFRIFLVETDEKLIAAQDKILSLEKDPGNRTTITDLFRIFHTIKGESGFLRLASFGELAHSLENILDLLRSGELEVGREIIDILLAGIDCANEILANHKQGNLTVLDSTSLTELKHLIEEQIQAVKSSLGGILVNEGKLTDADVVSILQLQKESSFTKKFGEIAVEQSYISQDDIESSLEKQKSRVMGELADPIIKVKASQINFLVDMVGELIISENQLDESDRRVVQLKKITREIQNAAMQLRTIKVKNLFAKMRRVLRDLSVRLDKSIDLETLGDDLEIDRDLVERLEEPLVHLLRNAAGHGIESGKDRLAKGKPETARIFLKGERRGNNIVITVEDDGRGLDREAIVKKAVSMKMITAGEAENLSDNDVYKLIYKDGFSTAEKVDLVSGRGVGMDIVRNVVASAKGKIEVETEKGKFTRFGLVFPLSTAIIDGMIVRSASTSLIIPVHNIIESLEITDNSVASVTGKAMVVNLRSEMIPLVELNSFFMTDQHSGNGKGEQMEKEGRSVQEALRSGQKERRLGVIVENSEKKKYALLVDEIIAKKEVVIKSLGQKFRHLKGISSGTVLHGGKIGFVMDIDQVVSISARKEGAHE